MKKTRLALFAAAVCFIFVSFAGDAPNTPHILFVNVAEAMKKDDFDLAVAKVAKAVPCPARVDSGEILPDLLSENSAGKFVDDKDAVLVVYVVRSKSLPESFSCPSHWSVVNLAQLESDSPSPEVLAARRAKIILRGLAYAAGAGATLEQRCLMFAGGLSLRELDAAPFALSPMAQLPMLVALEKLFGEDAQNDEEP